MLATLPESITTDEPPEDQEDDPIDALATDEVFHLLQNARRRHALRLLVNRDGEVDLSELAEEVAARENDKPVGNVSSSERKRVYIALYQSHLPKLDQEGVVDYDQGRGRVRFTGSESQLRRYLDVDGEEAAPGFGTVYWGLSGFAVLAGAASLTLANGFVDAGVLLPVNAALLLVLGVACAAVTYARRG